MVGLKIIEDWLGISLKNDGKKFSVLLDKLHENIIGFRKTETVSLF